jgi:serine/threonine protein kinase
MVTNDLGACEWFVWDLRRSSLIDRGQLDQIVGEFLKRNPRAEAPALAEYLVQQNTLTAFQAERILNGKTAGLVLGPYVLLDAIGSGSMGQVFKASSKNDSTLYAVKVLPRRSMWNVRLARRQVRSFSQFTHPAVVPFMDVGTAGGLHYLVWPLADGQTLEKVVQQDGRIPSQQTALVAVQIAQGMHAAHQNSIFHGLVKPSNVMVGADNQARILDFGIGSLLVENDGESLVDTMSTANTLTSGLDCSSPESVMDPTNRTPAGDQYSLGCTLYYCLTGRVPFPEGSAVEKMMAHQTKEPPAISEFAPDCPDGLAQVVSRLMAKTPEERFSGMDEVVEALEPFLGDLALPAAKPAAESAHRMAGIQSAGRSNNGSQLRTGFAMPTQTPTPAASQTGLPGRSGFGQQQAPARNGYGQANPAPPPVAGPRSLPGRMAFQPPPPPDSFGDEVPLTAAEPARQFGKNDQSRISTGWTNGEQTERKKPAFGFAGMVAATLAVAALIFLAVKVLVLDKQ